MKTSIACISISNGKVFIAKRLPGGDMGERWEFPGGKVEAGESLMEAITREFAEEFGSEVLVEDCIAETTFNHNGQESLLFAYRVYPEKKPEQFVLTEHSEWEWVALNEIKNRPFVDSDLLLYEKIAAYMMAQEAKK